MFTVKLATLIKKLREIIYKSLLMMLKDFI
jgi:hypothetical protein